jgi:hypothetical protein
MTIIYKRSKFKVISVLLAIVMVMVLWPGVAVADTTPPAFVEGKYPTNNPQMAGSRQISIYFTAQEPAYYHAVLLSDGASAPSKEQVAAGQDASGHAAIRVYKNKGKETDITISGFVPLHGTDYDVYVVLKDDVGNLSEPAMVDFPSPPPANLVANGYPQIGVIQPEGSKQVQIKVKLQNIANDRKGKVYWVLLPDGAPRPSIEQVAAGTDGSDNTAITCGSPEFSQGSEETFLVTGATGGTAYDLYMVVGHTYYVNPLANCTDVLNLDITTPADIAGEMVCAIDTMEFGTLAEALSAAGDSATIRLLKSFTTVQTVTIDTKDITFDLNGKSLTITTAANEGLKVTGGSVALTGEGALNVTGKLYGVWADNSNVTVTNATASDTDISGTASGMGVYATGGSEVTVRGDATGAAHGVKAENASTKVTVNGNVSNSAQVTGAVHSSGQAEVLVKGNVISSDSYGVHAIGGTITVEGNVSASHGAMAEDMNSQIIIWGNLSGYNNGAIVYSGNGTITVDGEISANINYVQIGSKGLTKGTGVDDPAKPGYLKYSDNTEDVTGAVWVKDATSYTDAVAAAKTALTWESIRGANSTENNVTTNLINPLPTTGSNGTTITWSTSPIGWINTSSGAVTRPTSAQGNQTVTLTATIRKGSTSAAKDFTLTIKAAAAEQTSDEAIALDLAALTWNNIKGTNNTENSITSSLNFVSAGANGTTITWSASPAGWINTTTGAVNRPTKSQGNQTITLTATISKAGGTPQSKTFTITITALSSSSGGSGGGSTTPTGILVTSSGKTASENGVTVTFPAGAVESDIQVQVKEAALSAGMTLPNGSKLLSNIMDIIKDKSGNFKKAVTITLSFNKSEFNPDEYDIAIYYYDDDTGKWKALDNIRLNLEAGSISGDTTHFTKFAVIATPKTFKEEKLVKPVTPQPTVNIPSDISGHWAKDSIIKMINAGVISGYPDGTFKPDKTITRAEFTVMIVKALNLETRAGKTFTDTASHWAKESISTAAAYGIISGYDENIFGPDDLITREQAAVIIARAAKLETATDESNFTDNKAISSWAKKGVAAAFKGKFITGYPDGTFKPQGKTTRAEAAVIIGKLLK